jgi:hypothetical protein
VGGCSDYYTDCDEGKKTEDIEGNNEVVVVGVWL